jgi:hypothetical protein
MIVRSEAIMRGNPVAYRNLFRHLKELINYIEIALDSDFILEVLDSASYESERTFGKRHPLTLQLRAELKYLHKKYIDKKALPLDKRDSKEMQQKVHKWLKKYYRQVPI